MKKIICGIIIFAAAFSVYAAPNMLKTFEKSYKEKSPVACLEKGLKNMGADTKEPVSEENLSAINCILKHTYENNIHKMRGEEDNVVYTNTDGRETVYDKNGNLVTNAYNKGSFNYAPYDKPMDKFLLDIFPWLIWGNAKDDPTTFEERLYYYCMDLDAGIQSYIFLEDKSKLEKVTYSKLSDDEKLVYRLFYYLLFNKNYTVPISAETIAQLQESADSYWEYFYQIMELIGFRQTKQ